MSFMMIVLVLAAAALLAVGAAVGVGVMLLLRPKSPVQHHPNSPAAHEATTAAGYVPPENPYHSPAEQGNPTQRKQTKWLIVSVVVAGVLFGLLACGGVALIFLATPSQVIRVREDAVRAERQAQQAAEEARRLEQEMKPGREDALTP